MRRKDQSLDSPASYRPPLLFDWGSQVSRLSFLGVSFLTCKMGITKFTFLGPKEYVYTVKVLRDSAGHRVGTSQKLL